MFAKLAEHRKHVNGDRDANVSAYQYHWNRQHGNNRGVNCKAKMQDHNPNQHEQDGIKYLVDHLPEGQ